jgi:exopolyphosphatase / guanosine-5'-triphosphate,3'-diphosphate pyrophosphatase
VSDLKRLAAIDIGSNSVRLMVAEARAGGDYRILDDHKETTRLAHGLSSTGLLTAEAIAHSLAALRRMKTIVDGYGVERLEVIATSAVREAHNGPEFIRLVKEQLGLTVEIIPTTEEGRLSFLSAARQFDLSDANAVLVDLGGGSAELVFAAKGIIEEIHSLPIGAVRMTEAFLTHDPPTKGDLQQFRKHLDSALRETAGEPDFTPHLMVGAGGTFTALANISMRQKKLSTQNVAGYEMNRGEVRHILEHLGHMPLEARRNVAGLNPDRADIIFAGLFVIERLMKWLNVNRLLIHDRGVRDGLLLKMIDEAFGRQPGQEEKQDPLTSVVQFGEACGFEKLHAQQVAKLAGQLFDQLQQPLQLPPQERLLLVAAAWLHEVGYLINFEKHHHHSYHLILHGNLIGLSARQRELVANIARYHRKALPKKKHDNFTRLSPDEQATVERLSALLRLADGLDRTHTQNIKGLTCQCYADTVRLIVTADTFPEVDLWGAEQKGVKLFQKVFDRELEFVWQPTRAADHGIATLNGTAVAASTRSRPKT